MLFSILSVNFLSVFEEPHVQNKSVTQFHGLLLAVCDVLKFKSSDQN